MKTPRWLAEVVAWAASLVLIAGIIGAWSIRGLDTTQEAQAETPVVEPVTEVRTKVPVKVKKAVPAKSGRSRAAALPPLGPPPGPQYDAPPAQTAPPEQRFAFIAGITNYRAPTHDTIGAANDARFIAALLERNGWLPENIRVVTDGDATGSAIRSGLAWLAS